MKLLTRDTDYAVRAIVYMAKDPDQVTSVQELVNVLGMPKAFSRRILQVLSRKGILASAKGKGGGFVIKTPVNRITLSEIMEAFQGPLSAVSCSFKKRSCPNTGSCPLRCRMKKIEGMILKELRRTTIGNLIGDGRSKIAA